MRKSRKLSSKGREVEKMLLDDPKIKAYLYDLFDHFYDIYFDSNQATSCYKLLVKIITNKLNYPREMMKFAYIIRHSDDPEKDIFKYLSICSRYYKLKKLKNKKK